MKFITLIFILVSIVVSAQRSKESASDNAFNSITFGTRALAFVTYSPDTTTEIDDAFAFNNSTQLLGANLSVNYNIINGISIGLASGIERFTQPNFEYVPLYARLALNGGT